MLVAGLQDRDILGTTKLTMNALCMNGPLDMVSRIHLIML
jgi:hypothetical protein